MVPQPLIPPGAQISNAARSWGTICIPWLIRGIVAIVYIGMANGSCHCPRQEYRGVANRCLWNSKMYCCQGCSINSKSRCSGGFWLHATVHWTANRDRGNRSFYEGIFWERQHWGHVADWLHECLQLRRLNRHVALWNIRQPCSSLATTLVNTYHDHSDLFAEGTVLQSQEGTTQGDVPIRVQAQQGQCLLLLYIRPTVQVSDKSLEAPLKEVYSSTPWQRLLSLTNWGLWPYFLYDFSYWIQLGKSRSPSNKNHVVVDICDDHGSIKLCLMRTQSTLRTWYIQLVGTSAQFIQSWSCFIAPSSLLCLQRSLMDSLASPWKAFLHNEVHIPWYITTSRKWVIAMFQFLNYVLSATHQVWLHLAWLGFQVSVKVKVKPPCTSG